MGKSLVSCFFETQCIIRNRSRAYSCFQQPGALNKHSKTICVNDNNDKQHQVRLPYD